MEAVSNQTAEVLARIKDLVNRTYEAKLASDVAEKTLSELKQELTELMSTAEVDKFTGDDATASCKLKASVSLPKDIVIKNRVFEYISTTYGNDVLFEMLTINPASFNSWFNAEMEKQIIDGNLDFSIEGLKPHEYFSVGFRKR